MHFIGIVFASCLGVFVLFCLLYLLSVRPGGRREEAAAFFGRAYAHRGLHGDGIPENSPAAFRAALEAGYGIELDVQLSRDGVPVVFHDATLSRVCGIDGRVSDYTAEELGRMSLLGTDERIPTFAAVLSLVDGRVPLMVEIKVHGDCDAVCAAACALLDTYRGPYLMESFNPFAVNWFRKNRPAVIRGQLSSRLFVRGRRHFGNLIVSSLCSNFITRPDFISFCFSDRGMLSFRLATRFYAAYSTAWTVKSEADEAAAKGFDGIIFEGYLPKEKNA